MVGREHERVPLAVAVRYRTARSFLVAYSVNLSRGGAFLETPALAPLGAALTLRLEIPDAGSFEVDARVSWVRSEPDPASGAPAGMGIEFADLDSAVGAAIDGLIASYSGLTVLLYSADTHDRQVLARTIRSIMSTADVVQASGAASAAALLDDDIDLAVIDARDASEIAWEVLARTRAGSPELPTVVLADSEAGRARGRELGVHEVTRNPPAFGELQAAMLAALGRPTKVRSGRNDEH